MTEYLFLPDLAEKARDKACSQAEFAAILALAQQYDPAIPDMGDGPVADELREQVADCLAVAEEETLIPDDEFEDYARELAYDIGAISREAPWPQSCIDWEAAADALQVDFTSWEYDGRTYWSWG